MLEVVPQFHPLSTILVPTFSLIIIYPKWIIKHLSSMYMYVRMICITYIKISRNNSQFFQTKKFSIKISE